MYTIWSYLVILGLALIAGGILWFVLVMFGKAIFEDFMPGFIKKFKRKQPEPQKDDEDFYVY